MKFHYILQKEVCKPDIISISDEFTHTLFSADDDWKSILESLEDNLDINCQPVLFVSIQVARWVKQNLNNMRSGLILPIEEFSESILYWNRYATALPADWVLNSDAIIIPIGLIPSSITKIERTYGNHVFTKPLSPWKTFTGFDCTTHSLTNETFSVRQSERVRDGELVLVTSHKHIHPVEYRCWCIDGKVVAHSRYSWEDISDHDYESDAISQVVHFAESVASLLEYHSNALVVDVGIHMGMTKLIELNAMSTSGWYQDLSVSDLLTAVQSLYMRTP